MSEAPSPHTPGPRPAAQAVWAALVAGALLYSFFSGFRMPSDWAINYYQPAWQDGIYRRALIGTLLYPLGCLRFDIAAIYTMQLAVLGALLGLALACAWRYRLLWALLFFFAGASGGLLFNLTGYVDPLLYLMALGSLLLARRHPNAAAALMAASLLVHEAALLLVPPLVAAGLCLSGEYGGRRWLRLFLPTAVMAVVVYVAVASIVQEQAVQNFYAAAAACGFEVRRHDYYFDLPSWSSFGYYYGTDRYYVMRKLAPLLLLSWALVSAIGQQRPLRAWEKMVLAVACLSPLLLGFVAWDGERWRLLSLMHVLFVLMLAAREARRRGQDPSFRHSYVFFPFIVVACIQHYQYYDGWTPRELTPDGWEQFLAYLRDGPYGQ